MRISRILFTNTILDDLGEDSENIFSSDSTSEVCYLCRKAFSLMDNKYNCGNCKMPVCISHSTSKDLKSRLCDNCRHELLVEEVWNEKKAIKDHIINSIQQTIKDLVTKEEDINNETIRIAQIQSDLQSFKAKAEIEEKILEDQIEKIIKDNNSIEKKIDKLVNEGKNTQLLEIDTVDKIAKAHEKLQISKIELKEAGIEKKKLEAKISKFSDRGQGIDWEEVKPQVCKVCLLKIMKTKKTNSHNTEISRNVCSCISF
jgi:uncharacterized protein (DUF3084 family)